MAEADTRVILGCSIGEQPGESAIAIVYREVEPVGKPETFISRIYSRTRRVNAPADKDEIGTRQALRHIYAVRHLERPPGELVDVIARVTKLLVSISEEETEVVVILDVTGVGHPAFAYMVNEIRDLEKPMRCAAREIVVSNALGGSGENGDGALVVPRRDLISAGKLAFSRSLLKVAPRLKLAGLLRDELGSFTRKALKTDAMDPWKLGTNDDLVLATTIALYISERFFRTAPYAEDVFEGTPFDSTGGG